MIPTLNTDPRSRVSEAPNPTPTVVNRVRPLRALFVAAEPVSSSRARPLKILIVDDAPAVRDFVDRVLRGAGYQTRVAASGEEALRAFDDEGPFDLLLADLMMPGMLGDELARRVRLKHPDQRVLYLTAFCDRLFAQREALWDHEAFVNKPATIDGLCEAVSLILLGHTRGLMTPTVDRSS